MILEYYFQFLAGIPASHARARLTLLVRPRQLAALADREDPGAAAADRAHPRRASRTPTRTYMTVFNSTPLERKLAVLLGIPLNGVDPKLTHLGTKSGSRQGLPRGRHRPSAPATEDLRTEHEVENALLDLQRPQSRTCGAP